MWLDLARYADSIGYEADRAVRVRGPIVIGLMTRSIGTNHTINL